MVLPSKIYGLTGSPLLNISLYFMSVILLYVSYIYKNEHQIHWCIVICTVLFALYVVDFIGAILHFYLDNYTGKHKIISYIARDFQIHHKYPSKIAHFSIVDLLNEVSMLVFLPLTCFILNMWLKYFNISHYVFQVIILFQIVLFTVGIFSQVPHTLAHKMNILSKNDRNTFKYRIIHMLQAYHIILNPKNHNGHHTYYDKNFSVFNGWSTSLVNRCFSNP